MRAAVAAAVTARPLAPFVEHTTAATGMVMVDV